MAEPIRSSGARTSRGSRLWRIFVWLLRRVLVYGLPVAVAITVLLVLPLRWIDPPISSFMLQTLASSLRAGEEGRMRHQWVPLQQISPHLQVAAITAEDQRFPDHRGFDTEALREAVAEAIAGDRLRGASTISQQTAKNLYLWHGRSMLRKAMEAWFVVWMELFWSKERILEVYLNIAEWDDSLYGAEAAARHYFGKSAASLTSVEAALLAAVLPNPHRLRVDRPSSYVLERQLWILAQMESLGGVRYLGNL